MPIAANIQTSLRAAGTDQTLFTCISPASGMNGEAFYRSEASHTIPAYRDTIKIACKGNSDDSLRTVKVTFRFPEVVTLTTGELLPSGYVGATLTLSVPQTISAASVQAAVLDIVRTIADETVYDILLSQTAPT